MAKIAYEVRCLRCGHVIRGQRGEDEHKKSFECKRCTGKFSVTFELPDLEQDFLAGNLRPDIFPRAVRPVEDNFPSAIFNFLGRKNGR